MGAPVTIQDHLVSLGFSVDQASYAKTTNAIDSVNVLVAKFASQAKAKFAEAALSVMGFEQALKKIHTPHLGTVGTGHGGGSSSGSSNGPAGEFGKVEKGAKKAGTSVQQFAVLAVKYFGEASVAFAGLASAVAGGTVSMLNGLGNQEIQMQMLARSMWTTQRQAYAFSLTLKALGANLQDLYLSPTLMAQYTKLHAVALQMQTPGNYNAQMGLIQGVSLQIKQMKLEANYALQWIGYYFIRYLQGPVSKVQAVLQSINGQIVHNMPTWTRKVAAVMASFMQAGIYIVQALGDVYNWLAKMLAYVPGWAKGVASAVALVGVAFNIGPIGLFMTAISGALLLVDDFMTYLHGGKSALGPFWHKVLAFFKVLNKSGGVVAQFAAAFQQSFASIGSILKRHAALWSNIVSIVKYFVSLLFSGLGLLKGPMQWLISSGLPGILNAILGIAQGVTGVIRSMDKFGATKAIIEGLLIAWGVYKAVLLAMGLATKIAAAAQWLLNAAMDANPIGLIVTGIGLLIAGVILLVQHWNAVKTAAGDALKWITSHLAFLLPAFGPAGWMSAGIILLVKNFGALKTAGVNVWAAIVNASRYAINWMISGINGLIKVMDLMPGIHIKPLTPIATITAGSPTGAPSPYAYHPKSTHSVSHKAVHITQNVHIHGSGSPEATGHAVGRTFNRNIHSLRGVIG